MSIQAGRVYVDGTVNVRAHYSLLASALLENIPVGATVLFAPSGAVGRVAEHSLVQKRLVIALVSGTPSLADTVAGPKTASVFGGVVGTTFPPNAFNVTPSPGWTTNEHVGKWIRLRPGPTEEWQKITGNSSNLLSISPEVWDINPLTGNSFTLHEEQSSPNGGWVNGSPVDWSALGVVPGDPILINGIWYDIQSVGTDSLQTSAAVAFSADNLAYSIHKGFTPLGIPYLNPGDTQIPAVDRRAKTIIDSELTSLKAESYSLVRTPIIDTDSGAAFDILGIPSWVQRITIQFALNSLDGNDDILVQIGSSSGFATSSYTSKSNHGVLRTSTAGFIIALGTGSSSPVLSSASMIITRFADSQSWISTHLGESGLLIHGAGTRMVPVDLDRIRITRTGTNNFDAGFVTVLYEGHQVSI